MRLALRRPDTADIVYEHTDHDGAGFEIVEGGTASGDVLVSTDAANRYSASGVDGQHNAP
jgi:hypothetical protein